MSNWGHVRVAMQGPDSDLDVILERILDDSDLVARHPRNQFSLAPKTEDETFTEFEYDRATVEAGAPSMRLSYYTNHGASNIPKWDDIAAKHQDVMLFVAWAGDGGSAAAFIEAGEIEVWYAGCWDDDLVVKREEGCEYPVPYPFEETVEGHLGEIKEWLERMVTTFSWIIPRPPAR